MYTRRCLVFLCCLLSCGLAACAGGSGSSGFDNHPPQNAVENAAIQQALAEQRCIQHESLTICPAAAPGTPTATPTATPPATLGPPQPTSTPGPSTSTPGAFVTVTPTGAPTLVPATPQPTASHTATATPTVTASAGTEQVTLDINSALPVACTPGLDGGCGFDVRFTASGFAPTVVFHVAVRTLNPNGPWMIGVPFAASGAATSNFNARATISGAGSAPASSIAAQAAVLVFANAAAEVPPSVTELVDSGAEAAFVTPQFVLQPQ